MTYIVDIYNYKLFLKLITEFISLNLLELSLFTVVHKGFPN